MNSIQLSPKAMIFDATITMMLNLISSRGPHTRSRYLAAAGRAMTEMMNWSNYYGQQDAGLGNEFTHTCMILVSTHPAVKKVHGNHSDFPGTRTRYGGVSMLWN
jgi:hypothetical protein